MAKPNPMPNCATCQKPFLKKWKRAKYCSIECQIFPRITLSGDCHLWQGAKNSLGYGQIAVMGDRVYVHRKLWESKFGPLTRDQHLCHRCDTPSCVNLDHLFLGSYAANMSDMNRKLRHGRRRLSPEQVREIRALNGIVQHSELARRYGVGRNQIAKITSGATWKWLE